MCNPPSSGHPPRFVVEACSEGPSRERMPTCVSTAHLHQPRLQPASAQDGNQHSGVLSAHPRTRGRMPARAMIPPRLHSPRCPAYHLLQGNQGLSSPPQPRRDHAPCSQVTRDSPSNPTHHARPLVSALPPRCVHPAILDRSVVGHSPSETGHAPRECYVSLLHRLRRVQVTARRTGR